MEDILFMNLFCKRMGLVKTQSQVQLKSKCSGWLGAFDIRVLSERPLKGIPRSPIHTRTIGSWNQRRPSLQKTREALLTYRHMIGKVFWNASYRPPSVLAAQNYTVARVMKVLPYLLLYHLTFMMNYILTKILLRIFPLANIGSLSCSSRVR